MPRIEYELCNLPRHRMREYWVEAGGMLTGKLSAEGEGWKVWLEPMPPAVVLIQRIGHTDGVHIKPNRAICGIMLESNVEAGKQPFIYGETRKEEINPYVSITDACIGWEETEEIILAAHRQM